LTDTCDFPQFSALLPPSLERNSPFLLCSLHGVFVHVSVCCVLCMLCMWVISMRNFHRLFHARCSLLQQTANKRPAGHSRNKSEAHAFRFRLEKRGTIAITSSLPPLHRQKNTHTFCFTGSPPPNQRGRDQYGGPAPAIACTAASSVVALDRLAV
jgi:hypothetical protein